MFSICINYKQTQGEILNWQDKLNKQGYVQLDNFLTDKVANRLLKSLKNNSHSNAWRLLSRPNQSLPMINASFKNSGLFRQAQKLAISGHKRRQFAFSFWRSSNRYIETNKMKPVIEIFKSEILRNVAAVIKDKPSLTDCFAAKLECNQFIDYHTDGPAGENLQPLLGDPAGQRGLGVRRGPGLCEDRGRHLLQPRLAEHRARHGRRRPG